MTDCSCRVEETVDNLIHGGSGGHGSLIRRLSREMISILDLEVLTNKLVETLKDVLVLESVGVILLDPAQQWYDKVDAGAGPRVRLAADHPLIARVHEHRDPVLAPDLLDEAATPNERAIIGEALDSMAARLVVPVHLPEGGGCIGFLALGAKLTGGRFNAEERLVLSILSTQLGIAIRNARLHEEAVARKVVDQELAMARSIQDGILSGHNFTLASYREQLINQTHHNIHTGDTSTSLARVKCLAFLC